MQLFALARKLHILLLILYTHTILYYAHVWLLRTEAVRRTAANDSLAFSAGRYDSERWRLQIALHRTSNFLLSHEAIIVERHPNVLVWHWVSNAYLCRWPASNVWYDNNLFTYESQTSVFILAGGRRSKTKPKQINLKRSWNNLDNRLILYYTNLATDRQTNGLIHTRFSSFVCPRIDRF